MNRNINLNKYNLNKVLRNPGLIHSIQDNLMGIKEGGILGEAIRKAAKDTPNAAVKLVVECYRDNPRLMKELVGTKTLSDIEEYLCITLADDLEGVNL